MTSGEVPAGGAGADSGAVDSARIDPDDTARIQNIGSENGVPGVGTRAADGSMENADKRAAAADSGESAPRAVRADDADADDSETDDSDTGLSIEEFEPGVDREHARQSRIVDKD